MPDTAEHSLLKDIQPLLVPDDADLLIQSLLAASSPFTGAAFLDQVVQNLGTLFQAETTLMARRLEPDKPIVRVLSAWKDGKHKESWDYDLTGNPCLLPYEGKSSLIPCDVMTRFEKKRDSGYESFVGHPLRNQRGDVIGHIAVYNSKRLEEDPKWLNITSLFAGRAEAELHRILLEDERAAKLKELETANSDLQELSRLKSIFLGTAAHDLRNPLSVISAYARIISSASIPKAEANKMAERICVATDRMVDLIDSYLDAANIEDGKLSIEKAPVLLKEIVFNKLELLSFLARTKNITIRTDLTDIASTKFDELRIEQVVDNLVGNAIKFSPQDSTIEVTLTQNDNSATLSVSDQGGGFPEDAKQTLFRPFISGGAVPTGVEKSAGLGLAIVKRIVEAHGGTIAASNRQSGGARFSVTLPLDGNSACRRKFSR